MIEEIMFYVMEWTILGVVIGIIAGIIWVHIMKDKF